MCDPVLIILVDPTIYEVKDPGTVPEGASCGPHHVCYEYMCYDINFLHRITGDAGRYFRLS